MPVTDLSPLILVYQILALMLAEAILIVIAVFLSLLSLSLIKKTNLPEKWPFASKCLAIFLPACLVILLPYLLFTDNIEKAAVLNPDLCQLRYVLGFYLGSAHDAPVTNCYNLIARSTGNVSSCVNVSGSYSMTACISDNVRRGSWDCSGFGNSSRLFCLNTLAKVTGNMSVCNDDAYAYQVGYYQKLVPSNSSSMYCIMEALRHFPRDRAACDKLEGEDFINFCRAAAVGIDSSTCESGIEYTGYPCERVLCGKHPDNELALLPICIAMQTRNYSLCSMSGQPSSCMADVAIWEGNVTRCASYSDELMCALRIIGSTTVSCTSANLSHSVINPFPVECGFSNQPKANVSAESVCGFMATFENQEKCLGLPEVLAYSCFNSASYRCGDLCRNTYENVCSVCAGFESHYNACIAEMGPS